MSKLIKTEKEYATWIKTLSNRFKQSQIKASVRVNSEMLLFYWNLGADMDSKKADSKYGSGFFKNLSLDLGDALPGQDFSPSEISRTSLNGTDSIKRISRLRNKLFRKVKTKYHSMTSCLFHGDIMFISCKIVILQTKPYSLLSRLSRIAGREVCC